jgi:hypothetical protein
MTDARWCEIERLFDLAVAHGPGERTAVLRDACDDPELRRDEGARCDS